MDPPPDTTRPASPLLPDLAHPLRPRLLVLLLQGALLRRVLLHALGDGLVVLGDVVEQPLQALLDGLVHLLAVAQDGGAGFLLGGWGWWLRSEGEWGGKARLLLLCRNPRRQAHAAALTI